MLVKPTVAELLNKGHNRYQLVIASAKRARQIAKGSAPMVETTETKPVSIAAEEIEAEKLQIYNEEQWKELDYGKALDNMPANQEANSEVQE